MFGCEHQQNEDYQEGEEQMAMALVTSMEIVLWVLHILRKFWCS